MVKAGKGYRDGKPIGPIGGKCKECDGNVISIKMNTSARGFETTSEKVCDTCGLVVPGAFQVLEPQPPYKSRYYDTHADWVAAMKPDPDMDDVDAWLENGIHLYGGSYEPYEYANQWDKNKRLIQAEKRLASTNQSKYMPMKVWRDREYEFLVDDYAHTLDLLPYQIVDVKYIIDHQKTLSKFPYKMEDIIYNLCLIIGKKDLRKYKNYNKNLYDLLIERLDR